MVGSDSVGSYFGLPNAACFSFSPISVARFSVTRLKKAASIDQTFTVKIPPQSAYFLMLYLQDTYHCDIDQFGSRTPVRYYPKGSICLVDIAVGASICLHADLDALAFRLPRALFNELTRLGNEAQLDELQCKRGHSDSVISNLGVALLQFFETTSSDATSPDACRHIALAVCAHLIHCYGNTPLRSADQIGVFDLVGGNNGSFPNSD
ncbi:hypothetical protein CPY51_30215 [Rhizobium tubonense]|uniref:AraC family transcriptional regulator n=2 Tax=Rhizobium tubonense TaxID=484088 RepID=A0A2W4C3F9_9HYPH|nr:hypothetical protein CPY51_30215 [Rhizobium tubonense]